MAVSGPSQSARASRRSQGATPARNGSPSRHGTRSGSTAPQATPGTRKSTRAASQRLDQPKDVVSNAALPEIPTRQSHAYGASKAPQLPEQLYARGTMSMQQVANQINADISRAQKTLGEHADAQDYSVDKPQASQQQQKTGQAAQKVLEESRAESQRQLTLRQTTPISQTTEIQKQRRTAAWASSLEDSPLNPISEEPSLVDTPETKRTEPSSFPSGIFDHSYAYERGMRAPRAESRPSPITRFTSRSWHLIKWSASTVADVARQFAEGFSAWFWHLSDTATQTLSKIPQSSFVAAMLKSFYILSLMAGVSMAICFVYTHHLCDASSPSWFSQNLQTVCGTCKTTPSGSWNLTALDSTNVHKIMSTLNTINSRVNSIESRLTNKIDSRYAIFKEELNNLRGQQSDLLRILEHLGQGSDADVASPLIPRINFFAPSNGAVVNPGYTSPTRSHVQAWPVRVALKMVGLKKYGANGPVTALLPWQDVGDCWCASASAPGHDSIRLGVELKELIFPTELVIEHPPFGTTLSPETALRDIELWASIDHLTQQQRHELRIDSMRIDGDGNVDPISNGQGSTFIKLASVEYDASPNKKSHVQRFRLDVNQHTSDLKYTSQRFVVRGRTNHGAKYSCLYRVRLHGVPVAEDQRTAKVARE